MQKQQGYLEGSLEEISSDESDAGLSLLSGGTLHVGVSDDTHGGGCGGG